MLKCPFDGPFTALKCPFQMAPCPFENLGRTLVWLTELESASVEALHSSWCGAGRACYVSLLSVPVRGWRLSALDGQRQSLPRPGAEHRSRIQTTRYSVKSAVDDDGNLLTCGLLSRRGHNIRLQRRVGLEWRTIVFWQSLPWLYQKDDG